MQLVITLLLYLFVFCCVYETIVMLIKLLAGTAILAVVSCRLLAKIAVPLLMLLGILVKEGIIG